MSGPTDTANSRNQCLLSTFVHSDTPQRFHARHFQFIPPLPLRYKVLASTLYTTPPPEPDTHIIPGRRKKNLGSSGRGAIMFTLADTS